MTTANAKLRRLAVFYCIVILVFIPRAAWAGFLTYASSELETQCGSVCDPSQPVPALMYNWTLNNQEIPSIFYAFSSAMLSVVSVWFILTADEKRLLRTGAARVQREHMQLQVQGALHLQVGLDSLL